MKKSLDIQKREKKESKQGVKGKILLLIKRLNQPIARKNLIRILAVFVGVFLLCAVALAVSSRNEAKKLKGIPSALIEKKNKINQEKGESKVLPRRLDGLIVAKEDANRYPVAVMIENLSSIRPQKGLSKASIVYETIVEGGITRFMAIFGGEQAKEIWPVRSARPYYLEWASEYKALYAHCGGSPEALQLISAYYEPDLNQMYNPQYFWRGRGSSPHNLYTSTELLTYALRDKGYLDKKPNFLMWSFKDSKKLDERPDEEKFIKINFSSYPYMVEYKYDKKTNDYLRFNGGVAHIDLLTGQQLRAKNVIVQIVPPVWPLSSGKGRVGIDVVGENKVLVFRDGEVIEGKWYKKDRDSRTLFYDQNNKEIQLNRGQIWIEIIPEDRSVEYN